MLKGPSSPTLAIVAVGLLVSACGGGSSSSSPDARGVLVIPAAVGTTTELALASRAGLGPLLRMQECPDVPDGYQPLANVPISFQDANDMTVGTAFASDACGAFTAAVPADAVSVLALSDGFRPVKTDVSLFLAADGKPGLASTIPDTSSYRIGAIQALDANQLAFAVTDTDSGQAVLGVPTSAFTITLDDADATLTSVQVATSTTTSSSAVLVLDASGSMSRTAFTDPATDESFDRNQLATLAAHLFLDQKGPDDEVAALPFADDLFFMDQATVDAEIPLIDEDDNAVPYVLSEDGFVTDSSRLRLVIDSYNRESDLYPRGDDVRNADTPSGVSIAVSYPYGGGTAVYDAISEGVARLDARNVARPVVVAMTDGADNSSQRDVQEVIDEAVTANVPIYTIGFGGSTEEESLTRIATETGGTFFNVTSIEIADVYQGIQSGILFQYIATLGEEDIGNAMSLGVALDFNGVQTQRSISVSR